MERLFLVSVWRSINGASENTHTASASLLFLEELQSYAIRSCAVRDLYRNT